MAVKITIKNVQFWKINSSTVMTIPYNYFFNGLLDENKKYNITLEVAK